MQTWLQCEQVPADLPRTSVTIGTFDGVHRGHRVLLDRVLADAVDGLIPVVVTFDPHPMAVIRPDVAPLMLTTLDHRLELIAEAGIEGVLVLPFTKELAAEAAEGFAERVLAGTVRARRVVVGRNFRFGHRAAGDVGLLAREGARLGFDVDVVDLAPLGEVPEGTAVDEGDSGAVSSTAIRQLIAGGAVGAAAQALGRPHRVSGPVVRGDRRGRDLGFPTANVAVPEGFAVPGDGVYAAWFRASGEPGRWWPSAVSVGTNPTFGVAGRRVEAYVIDAPDGYDIYGQVVDVDFVERIRPMVRFDDVGELVARMGLDVEMARGLLSR